MRICRILFNGECRFGRVEGDEIVLLNGPFGAWHEDGARQPFSSGNLLAPVIPQNFFCAGLNYRGHAAHAGLKVPPKPDIGYRANNALIGYGADIVRPADFEGSLEYEGELVAVIGRTLRRASREEAAAGILGWTIGNDISAREWQRTDRTFWRGKNSDTFKPMGPWIDTDFTPAGAITEVRLNGTLSSTFKTDDMVYSAVDFITEITRYCTMHAGDVVWLGTDTTAPIAVGDMVEVSISGLATLGNRVVAEAYTQEGPVK